jgi:ribA/ribD-fused uncharacterized protein
MMYAKALLFDDHDVAGQIACEVDPAVQKRLGQQVKGFDQGRWDQWKIDIVYRGNFAKFSQNEGAQRQLRNTGDGLLVEANPRDWVWGNGRDIDHPAGHAPMVWRGENLLGLILTKVRMDLRVLARNVLSPNLPVIAFPDPGQSAYRASVKNTPWQKS